jgi:hypothetical protein
MLADAQSCDGCDRKLTIAYTVPERSAGRQRFLDVYRERLAVAPAARLAGVHRATVYRWMKDAAFRVGMRDAAEAFFRDHREKWLAAEAARQQWRQQRERERRPMRCRNLERAREAKRR